VTSSEWRASRGSISTRRRCRATGHPPLATGPSSLPERLQWGHGDGAVEESNAGRDRRVANSAFNGATAMEPWKRARLLDRLRQTTCARVCERVAPRGARWRPGTRAQAVRPNEDRLCAQREVPVGRSCSNIRIAKELRPENGLIHISAPHLSRVK
jgi:hypothetical protein